MKRVLTFSAIAISSLFIIESCKKEVESVHNTNLTPELSQTLNLSPKKVGQLHNDIMSFYNTFEWNIPETTQGARFHIINKHIENTINDSLEYFGLSGFVSDTSFKSIVITKNLDNSFDFVDFQWAKTGAIFDNINLLEINGVISSIERDNLILLFESYIDLLNNENNNFENVFQILMNDYLNSPAIFSESYQVIFEVANHSYVFWSDPSSEKLEIIDFDGEKPDIVPYIWNVVAADAGGALLGIGWEVFSGGDNYAMAGLGGAVTGSVSSLRVVSTAIRWIYRG